MQQIFLSSLSHELRTPLNTIVNIIQLMPSNSDKFNELYLKPLKNSSQYLLNLVNDILDIQKIKFNHKLILVKKEFNLI